jgi:hypothetical protein
MPVDDKIFREADADRRQQPILTKRFSHLLDLEVRGLPTPSRYNDVLDERLLDVSAEDHASAPISAQSSSRRSTLTRMWAAGRRCRTLNSVRRLLRFVNTVMARSPLPGP